MLNKELTLSVQKAPVLEIRFAEANECYVRYQDKTNRQQFAWAKYGLVHTVLISNILHADKSIIVAHFGNKYTTQNLQLYRAYDENTDFYSIKDRNKNALIKFE